jgi:hypothetical protein
MAFTENAKRLETLYYNSNQSGFRKNRNTMEQCIRLENDIGLYERGSLGFLPFLWIGIIIECFQSFGISCKNHILLINNKNILSVFSDKCLKSVVLTTTVVSLKHINNKLKIMIITILQIILTIIVIVIMINLLYRKCKMHYC